MSRREYPLSARYDDEAFPNRVGRAAADALYERMVESGYSERELCLVSGVTRRTWRAVTGRPYPTDPIGGRSLISLRDYVAICKYLNMDPVRILRDLLDNNAQPPPTPKDRRPTIYPIVEPRQSKAEMRAETEALIKAYNSDLGKSGDVTEQKAE